MAPVQDAYAAEPEGREHVRRRRLRPKRVAGRAGRALRDGLVDQRERAVGGAARPRVGAAGVVGARLIPLRHCPDRQPGTDLLRSSQVSSYYPTLPLLQINSATLDRITRNLCSMFLFTFVEK